MNEYQAGYHRHLPGREPRVNLTTATQFFHEYITAAGEARRRNSANALQRAQDGIAYWLGAIHALRSSQQS